MSSDASAPAILRMSDLPWGDVQPQAGYPKTEVTLEADLLLEDGGFNAKDTHPDRIVPKGTTIKLRHLPNYGVVWLPTGEIYKW